MDSDFDDDQIFGSDESFGELDYLNGNLQLDEPDYQLSSDISQNSIKLNHFSNSSEGYSQDNQASSNEIKAKYTPLGSEDSQGNHRIKAKQPNSEDASFDNLKMKYSPKESEKDSLNSFATAISPAPRSSRRSARSSKQKVQNFIDPDVCTRAEQLLKAGLSANQIRDKLGITQRSMKKLQAQYELYGKLIPSKGSSNSPKATLQKQKEYQKIQQILKGHITKNCSTTLRHMQKALRQNGISKSRSTIHALLAKMRFSRKKIQKIPLQRNTYNKIIYRQNYCRMIQQIPFSKQVFLDETIFGLQTAGHYGWAPKGEQPKIFVPANRRKHITLLAAISIRGFQATKIVKGPVTSKHVCEFLQHYLDHLQPDEILILDNARMHHAAVVKEKIKQLNRPIRFLPAYTPQLNPIQNVFSEIKAQYVRLKEDHDLKSQDMIRLIEQAIKNMRSKQFSMYYAHYEQWLKKGIAGDLIS